MITVYAAKDGTIIARHDSKGALFQPPNPDGAARRTEFDAATNVTLATILQSPDVEFLRFTRNGFTWHGVPIPVNEPHEQTVRQLAFDEAVARLFDETGELAPADLRTLLQAIATRVGITTPATPAA